MTIVYRTAGLWAGSDLGRDLTPTEVDSNFFYLFSQLSAVMDHASAGAINIDYFEVVGSQFYVHMTDHSVIGPYDLPVAAWNFRGDWTPSTIYVKQDVFSNAGSIYLVIFDHTSDVTFDPDANDGSGHNFYQLMLSSGSTTTVKTVTNHTYDLVTADAFSYIRFTNVGGCIVMISANAIVPFATGTEITLRDVSDSGSMTVVALSGVQLNPPTGFLAQSFGKHATMSLKYVGNDEWDLCGLLAAV